jgi:leucyl/phenylalanyl-tRNA---protein transferase
MLTIELLQAAYDQGVFPMAESQAIDAEISWFKPRKRAVFLPDRFHVPRRLLRFMKGCGFEIRWNDDFRTVMQECGAERPEGSWINPVLLDVYTAWHEAGGAYCLSVFQGDGRVGGIYGVQRGGVFMAESMFSRVSNASSVALVALIAGLTAAGIEIVDVQFENPHLTQFNPVMMMPRAYQAKLDQLKEKLVALKGNYFDLAGAISFAQSLTHTS